jgi:hypothetical protein
MGGSWVSLLVFHSTRVVLDRRLALLLLGFVLSPSLFKGRAGQDSCHRLRREIVIGFAKNPDASVFRPAIAAADVSRGHGCTSFRMSSWF